MKKIHIIGFLILTMMGTSCSDYLDVNTNTNQATSVSPELVMPQAIAATALVLNGYNTYGMQTAGYAANAGGYGGFNETVTYNYNSSNYSGLWPTTYDNLEDFQYIIDQTEGDENYSYFNATAKIMKAHGFQLLVDAYNSVPYSEALKGANLLTPKYDDPSAVYADLASQLDIAIATINSAVAKDEAGATIKELGSADILFAGDLDKWKQLANTIKLRLIVRATGKATFASTAFDAVGFLDSDALINPGYTRDVARQNPKWESWGFGYTGSAANKAWIPTTYVLGFYNGGKLKDEGRGAATFYQFPSTGSNQLGYENTGVPSSPTGGFWYPSANRTGTTAGDATGVLKGADAGYPLITAAESYFLQSEAVVRGLITTGVAKTLFESGITASFDYLYQLPDGTLDGDPVADSKKYLTENPTSYLVNFALATTEAQKIEAIITQKYIAMNMVDSQEGWNEYRRTGYPSVSGTTARGTFASIVSQSPRADRLPTRVLYPSSEASYNAANAPGGISSFTSLIFWAK
ncbi:SusD/RagB family nutrient-binding outer membrane lipoprotein [Dyadobacter sp. NIV53]|uniref:SusD/RagB family nutrient-binding outer membrane lipoprotein n=1 Tax=Dyadobacter sp. NIV53 TaxID=2861765 RepID=UPI001C86AADC|nr:SusD/RagB family nutrient-binding outer membrane lipoprotein [Dyadobacter sp. NIV53]